MPATVTSTAISQRRKTFSAAATRFSPSAPQSSMPGVSIISTGPSGSSSIAFLTASVVVPLTSLTTEISCPVTAFTRLLLPAFRTPKKPICVLSPDGVSFKPIIRFLSCKILNKKHQIAANKSCNQNLKSRSPFSILTRRSRTICLTFSLPILSISFSISASPFLRVSSLA